ncbi:hypothetical protein ENUP19_0263G0023 [Entamoeba nuttalli]|uniref:Uncharacterized protein n=2 Tax=Entamoeba nuttalli TaxID=412467 RepID=K2G7P3_ENTNP|nr:hypothetical protein ENU1_165180 [Entamoeba nuttalli P19]EKE38466.1 hypothetical protein ENU1_165180 [Entamoeba nuttalli P19]|eukprot:XP_008859199.1 hypothetical protein ENU1_165180 [Entamoeba nuttalli P19]
MFCLVFFIAIALAKDSIVMSADRDSNGNPITFLKFEFGTCYYMGAGEEGASIKLSKSGDNIKGKLYNEADCKGTSEEAEESVNDFVESFCSAYGSVAGSTCTGSITKAPEHVAFQSVMPDDADCSHKDNTFRLYYTDACYPCEGSSCKREEEDGSFFLNVYSGENCDGDRTTHTQLFKCDSCVEGVHYQCGAISTMVLAVVAILAFFL